MTSIDGAEPTDGAEPGTRRRYHHGDLERALVEEALAQVRARGADEVSLRQVAQAVGVSPSAAYAHFPDKQALLVAVGNAGKEVMDGRIIAANEAVTGDGDAAAVERFRATGRAYVAFAVEESHLFRHMFGPACVMQRQHEARGGGGGGPAEESVSYRMLNSGLDDLEARGLLRHGVREGLDLAAWTMVHGFSALVLDGFLPIEAGEILVDTLSRLALTEAARTLIART